MKIATHNSATGERGRGFLSFLVAPFSKCQSKTLAAQYEEGCRYFDIRYKWDEERDEYVCAHGLWTSEKTLREVLLWLNEKGDCYAMVTCESGAPLTKSAITNMIHNYHKVTFTTFNRKKPEWEIIYSDKAIPHINGYKVLDWSSWHTLLPIPWLWKKIYHNKPNFNNEVFSFVDFL